MNEPIANNDALQYRIYLRGSDWKDPRVLTQIATAIASVSANVFFLAFDRPHSPTNGIDTVSNSSYTIGQAGDYVAKTWQDHEDEWEVVKNRANRQGSILGGLVVWIMYLILILIHIILVETNTVVSGQWFCIDGIEAFLARATGPALLAVTAYSQPRVRSHSVNRAGIRHQEETLLSVCLDLVQLFSLMILSIWSWVSLLSFYLEWMDNLGAAVKDNHLSSSLEGTLVYAPRHSNGADNPVKIDTVLSWVILAIAGNHFRQAIWFQSDTTLQHTCKNYLLVTSAVLLYSIVNFAASKDPTAPRGLAPCIMWILASVALGTSSRNERLSQSAVTCNDPEDKDSLLPYNMNGIDDTALPGSILLSSSTIRDDLTSKLKNG